MQKNNHLLMIMILIAICNLISYTAYAGKLHGPEKTPYEFRQTEISGKITDDGGLPLPGATIRVKGGTIATVSDENGSYVLQGVEEDAVLTVAFTGFITQDVPVSNRSRIDVTLKTDNQQLNEVVVVGYGTQKKVNLTGALSVLNMEDKENTPITNVSQALHGVQGVWANQESGKPGADKATIRIRGVGTTNNSNPLVLVDGIEYDMNDVNPNDIENVTVLKDASAAIYGSRAANGVVLVTTKTGKAGTSVINYNFSQGIQQPTMMPEVEWDPILYMQARNQALVNEGKVVTYTDAQIDEYRNGMASNPYAYPNINWFDRVMDNGYLQQHSLRFSGGNDKTLYSLSLGFMDQDGILVAANHSRRYSVGLNLSSDITKNLKVGGTINANYRRYNENAHGTAYFFNRLMRVLPIFTPYLPDGRYGNAVFATPGRNAVENPLMLLNEGKNDIVEQNVLAKVYADYKLPFNLTYNITLGVDKLDGYIRQFVPYMTTYHPITEEPYFYNNNPYAYNKDDNNLNLSFYQTLSWTNTFAEKHHVEAMVGTSFTDFGTGAFSGRSEGFLDNALTDLSAGSLNMTTTGRAYKDKLASYFGRLNYDFDEKYLFEATFRFDGSARFARGNRWGFFPSASAGWRIDKESFFGDSKFVNLLKLRASYGELGNQDVPEFSYYNTIALGQDYSFGGNIASGAARTNYSDRDISWETTKSYNAGVDFEAWNGKLSATAEVFKKSTFDILRPVNLAAQIGNLGGPQRNIGSVDNTGYEISLSHRNTINGFTYEVAAGLTYVKNEITDLNGEAVIDGRRILKEGYPIDAYYVYNSEGIYQTQQEIDNSAVVSSNVKPGYLKYTDINGDDLINGDDRIVVGSSIPKYTYSFSLNLGYKGFQLNSFFQGVQGLSIYPTANLAYPINNGAGITKEWLTDSWTPERPNARLPILVTPQGATENYQNSTFWMRNGSYLRLQNVQLSYDLPANWISKVSLKKLTLFANGQNLITISKYKDFDTEKDIKDDTLYDYPMLKTVSFGLNATF